VRFRYAARDGAEGERTVEPVRMVATGRRWYLMAWDVDRDDWRTFRLDRMSEVVVTTWHFRAREHPDPVAYVQRSVTETPYRHRARVRIHARADRVRELVPPQVGRVEDDRDGWCVLVVGGESLDWVAVHVAWLGFEAEVLEPAELREAAAGLAHRLAAMAGAVVRTPPAAPGATAVPTAGSGAGPRPG
jgi:predicted DNA-binding transcriptional regulator YafY